MKKFIQVVSFLGLTLIFGGLSANAQAVTKVEANIPFDFVVGDKALAAGSYSIRVAGTASTVRSIEFRNEKNEVVCLAFAFGSGDSPKGKPELVFERKNGQATLAKVITETSGYTVPAADASKYIAAMRLAGEKVSKN